MKIEYQRGPIPALLKVYENVIIDFINFLKIVKEENYTYLVDANAEDKDCRSIQTIISHIINSGYGYAYYIRGAINVDSIRPDYRVIEFWEVENSLLDVFKFTEDTFTDRKISYEEVDAKIVKTPWNDDLYSIESILEHAVVHVLRHKIQIERFIKLINEN